VRRRLHVDDASMPTSGVEADRRGARASLQPRRRAGQRVALRQVIGAIEELLAGGSSYASAMAHRRPALLRLRTTAARRELGLRGTAALARGAGLAALAAAGGAARDAVAARP
jgi:hypothetical protein